MHLLGQHHLIFRKSCSDQLQEKRQFDLNLYRPCLLILLHLRLDLGRSRPLNQEISLRYNFVLLRIQQQRHHL